MTDVYKRIESAKVIPVMVSNDIEHAVKVGRILYENGMDVIEVTFRTQNAAAIIAKLREELPDAVIGAGTVISKKLLKDAIKAGAAFVVSPGIQKSIVQSCKRKSIPIIPGCVTPSEIELAVSLGLNVVKFFPAEASGGAAMIKALSAPYSGIRFMPTGGIGLAELKQYLSMKSVIACGGSFMINGDPDEVRKRSKATADELSRIRGDVK